MQNCKIVISLGVGLGSKALHVVYGQTGSATPKFVSYPPLALKKLQNPQCGAFIDSFGGRLRLFYFLSVCIHSLAPSVSPSGVI